MSNLAVRIERAVDQLELFCAQYPMVGYVLIVFGFLLSMALLFWSLLSGV